MEAPKRPYHHGDLRKALVEASRALVEERGAPHFSVAQAARAAGVSSAAPYRHFKDREELLGAVAEAGLLDLAQDFADAAAPHEPGSIDALTAIGMAYVAFARREPAIFRLMFAEHLSGSEGVCDAGKACKQHLLAHVAAHLRHDTVTEDTMRAAFPLWTMVHGLSFLMIDRTGRAEELDMPLEPMIRESTKRLLRDR